MYVYVLKCSNFYKIGYSKNPKNRRATVQTHNPLDVKICATLKTEDYLNMEKFLHQTFANRRTRGEWFELKEDDLLLIKIQHGFTFKIPIESINEDETFENTTNQSETKQIRIDNHKIDSIKYFFESTFNCTVSNSTQIRKCCLNFDEEHVREAIVSLFSQDKSPQEAYNLLFSFSKNNHQKHNDPKSYVIKIIKAIFYKIYEHNLSIEDIKYLEDTLDFNTNIDEMIKDLNSQKYYLSENDFFNHIVEKYNKLILD